VWLLLHQNDQLENLNQNFYLKKMLTMVVAVAVVCHDEVICLNQFFKRKLILIKIMKEGEREREG